MSSKERPFGVISDTHFGCKHFRPTALNKVIDCFYDYGVRAVLHAGDVIEGSYYHRGNQHNLKYVGMDAQIDYALKALPQKKGLKYYFIAGNHENSFRRSVGSDPGKLLESRALERGRNDLKYFGYPHAKLVVEGFRVILAHPTNYNRYVATAVTQRDVDLIICGHYHRAKLEYHGKKPVLMPGAFQSTTEWEAERGMTSNVGGWVVWPGKDLQLKWIRGLQ